jgi:hypothetical protein
MSTFLCRSGVITKQARQACRVAAVSLRKRLPHEAYLYVEPRVPAAAVSSAGNPECYMLVDAAGFVYESVRDVLPGIVRLYAFPTEYLQVGRPLEGRAAEIYQQVIKGIENGGAPLRKVDFRELANIVAFLEDGTKAKIGGLDNLERKFTIVGWILRETARRRMPVQYIDVRIPSQPVFMPRYPNGAEESSTSDNSGT